MTFCQPSLYIRYSSCDVDECSYDHHYHLLHSIAELLIFIVDLYCINEPIHDADIAALQADAAVQVIEFATLKLKLKLKLKLWRNSREDLHARWEIKRRELSIPHRPPTVGGNTPPGMIFSSPSVRS
jgi:hypothetical protein